MKNNFKKVNEKEFVSSKEYLEWLDTFSSRYNDFSDDCWDYDVDLIGKENYNNVHLLSYFFEYIADLANEQNVVSTLKGENEDVTFYFKLKNKYYSISSIYGHGSIIDISIIDNIDDVEIIKVDEIPSKKELKNRELIQYIIINKDYINKTNTTKFNEYINKACKICAIKENYSDKFLIWKDKSQKKVVLIANQSKLEKLEKQFYAIRDLGFTKVENGTLLAVSLGIMTRNEAKHYIKGLQLWKT